tara:strand:+ start:942 stop:1388 length:447 start_codon:yes stop_codon:yes gene_type:complete
MYNFNTYRPVYEKQMDRDNEAELALIVTQKWKCQMSKMKDKSAFDYAAIRSNEVMAFIEMKTRKTEMNKYPSYLISFTKVWKAKQLYQALHLPVFLLVKWADKIAFTALHNCKPKVQIGGRKDRQDPSDIEPVAMIPLEDFLLLGNKT